MSTLIPLPNYPDALSVDRQPSAVSVERQPSLNPSVGRAASKASLLITQEGQTVVSFEHLSYSVDVKADEQPTGLKNVLTKTQMTEKAILRDVSGLLKPNRLTAVMGSSGAGKTSLLSILGGTATAGTVTGTMSINGIQATPSDLKKISGFVFQDDVILQTMTGQEALTMVATLNLPSSLTDQERKDAVDGVVDMLKLEKARHTIVGDSEQKGLSGGERKRLACGMALISNPACLFLDEPTSGLDTFTAFKVVKILKDVAQTGRTVVATVHQPSAELFFMFDDLLLLAEGRTVYHGPTKDMVAYFEHTFGYLAPKYNNPADWTFSYILNAFRDDEAHSDSDSEAATNDVKYGGPPIQPKPVLGTASARIQNLLDTWPTTPEASIVDSQLRMIKHGGLNSSIQSVQTNTMRNFWIQFQYLFSRSAKNAWRNKLVIKAKAGQAIFLALFLGLAYLNIPGMDPSVQTQNFVGIIFFLATTNIMSSSMSVLSVFAQEKVVFKREFGSSYYGLPAFFFSKLGIELPVAIFTAILQATIIYWMVGLPNSFVTYVVFMLFVGLATICGLSIGISLASTFDSLEVALVLTPLILLPLMLFAGLFINTSSIGWWLRWLAYVSPVRWCAEGMIKVTLPPQIAQQFYPDSVDPALCAIILLGEALVLLCLAYFGLWRVTVQSKHQVVWKPLTGPKYVTSAEKVV
jgi:ABC-type multidrug transport system ATPase subunit/ABC-type multidrug transport system permease subunit